MLPVFALEFNGSIDAVDDGDEGWVAGLIGWRGAAEVGLVLPNDRGAFMVLSACDIEEVEADAKGVTATGTNDATIFFLKSIFSNSNYFDAAANSAPRT